MAGDNLIFQVEDHMITKIEYTNATTRYIGRTTPGTATSAASWQIRKQTLDLSGRTTDIQFASGTHAFDKIWDNRAAYIYS